MLVLPLVIWALVAQPTEAIDRIAASSLSKQNDLVMGLPLSL